VKLLFDHNLSPRLVSRIADLHPNSSHTFLLGLDQSSDEVLWERACQDGYTIVTKDSDFAELSVLRGFPPKVIGYAQATALLNRWNLLRGNHLALVAFEQDPIVGLISLF